MHDVFHFFTHLDKGFGYTIKQLVIAPGGMQRKYVEGERSRHQKPFSMFFICITIAALIRYWVYSAVLKYYDSGNPSEAIFFNEYMVIMQVVLLPLNIFITYLFFYKSKYNYAEIGVLLLYTISFFCLIVSCIAPLKFIWRDLDTAYIELPIVFIYNTITFINFFKEMPRWKVILKSTVTLLIGFIIVNYLEDWIIQLVG
ncbi:MAG: DUF3667 domain-containing protein [Chitinophagaceae bacterium]